MTETKQTDTTKHVNRRSAILAGAALASTLASVVATAPATALPLVAQPKPSPEFVAWQNALRTWRTAFFASEDGGDDPFVHRLGDAHYKALDALVEVIDAKDEPSLADVLELACAQRDVCYTPELVEAVEDLEGSAYIGEFEIQHALLRAVLRMGALPPSGEFYEHEG